MELHIEKDADQLSKSLAEWLVNYIQKVTSEKPNFSFVLSGGGTPKKLYNLLAQSPYRERIPWEKMVFFWGDERGVPLDDPRNNAKMCYDELLTKVPVLGEHIHIMRTDVSPEESAAKYQSTLEYYFKDAGTTFDFVLLGMGDDGHTLSLFPGTDVIHEHDKWATSFFLEAQDMHRITLTAPVVNKARCVAFLATGPGKAEVLKSVLEGPADVDLYPSQIIQPENGELHWFVDEAAASQLS